ncbi:MAG: hypothetical protein EBZ48_16175 [Proteobacteria bacterium]|nr:hypothetical protein [Pseudomonadota bacterium]
MFAQTRFMHVCTNNFVAGRVVVSLATAKVYVGKLANVSQTACRCITDRQPTADLLVLLDLLVALGADVLVADLNDTH